MEKQKKSLLIFVGMAVLVMVILSRTGNDSVNLSSATPSTSASVDPSQSSNAPQVNPSANEATTASPGSTKKPVSPTRSPRPIVVDGKTINPLERCSVPGRVSGKDGDYELRIMVTLGKPAEKLWAKATLNEGTETFEFELPEKRLELKKNIKGDNLKLNKVELFSASSMDKASLLCDWTPPVK